MAEIRAATPSTPIRSRLEHVNPIDGRILYVRPREVCVPALAFSKLDNVGIHDERTFDTRPFGSQRVTTPRHQGEVHARRSTEVAIEVVVARMTEIAAGRRWSSSSVA